MNKELIKELSRLQLLSSRCKNKMSKCPLSITLEENKDKINWYENFEINKTIDKLRIKHNNQQKEFMKFLEDNWKQTQDIWYIKILQKYKEIIGGGKE